MNFPDTTILHPDHPPSGFTTPDWQFAAVPYGNEYMIIADGKQLELCPTRELACIRLEQLKNSHRPLKKGTKTPAKQNCKKKAKTPSGGKGSKTTKPSATKTSTKKPKSPPPKTAAEKPKPKSKKRTVAKPSTLPSNPLLDALS